jgi:C4-dicarboxylate-specific signal transduction histidine kinase
MTMTRSPSPPTRESADSIRNLLEQKLAAYRRFLSITETLGQKISDQAMEETGKLIAWRQDCIGRIETLDSRMKALESSAPKASRRTEADAAVEDCRRRFAIF